MARMKTIFSKLLHTNFDLLPAAVKSFHDVPHLTFTGFAKVSGATNLPAKFLRIIFDLPRPAAKVTLNLVVWRSETTERWQSNFAGHTFISSFCTAASNTLLCAHFGLFRFYFRLSVKEQKMHWQFMRWSIGSFILPLALGPRIVAHESEGPDGSYQFFCQVIFPLIGELICHDWQLLPR